MITITDESQLPGSEGCEALYLNGTYLLESNQRNAIDVELVASRLAAELDVSVQRVEVTPEELQRFFIQQGSDDGLDDWNANDIEEYLAFTHPVFGSVDDVKASNEGWGVFLVNGKKGIYQFSPEFEAAVFSSEEEVWSFVIQKAVIDDSELHKKALNFMRVYAKERYDRFVDDVQIIDTNDLDESDASGFTQRWQVQFANGECLGFDTEEAACANQRIYRQRVGLVL